MRTAAAVTALVLTWGAAGCSPGEAEPVTLPPVASESAGASGPPGASGEPGTSASPTAPPSSKPVVVPDAAKEETPQGASAFARHYMTILEAALGSGQTRELRRLSDPGCGGCNALLAAIDSANASGQRVTGSSFVVEFAEAPAVQAGETIVDLRYNRQPGSLVDADGAVVSPIAAEGPVDAQMRLKRVDEIWLVLGFRQVQA